MQSEKEHQLTTTSSTPSLTVKITADDPDLWRKCVVDLARTVSPDNAMHVHHRTDFLEGFITLRTGPQDEGFGPPGLSRVAPRIRGGLARPCRRPPFPALSATGDPLC